MIFTPRALVLCLAMATAVSATLASQARVEAPGVRQPRAPGQPRIAPLPAARWTDVERQLVEKYGAGGRTGNALHTLLHLPALVDAVMPYTVYLEDPAASRSGPLMPRGPGRPA
jgi:hypothetical protein